MRRILSSSSSSPRRGLGASRHRRARAPFASGLAHPLLGRRPPPGDAGGRAARRADRWAGAVGLSGGVPRGDGARRGARASAARCCRGWSRRSSPRWWCWGRRPPSRCGRRSAVACAVIAAFGMAHGYAHGLEAPALGGAGYGLRVPPLDRGSCMLAGLAAPGAAQRPAVARALGAAPSPASAPGEGVAMIPGEVFPAAGEIVLNEGREAVALTVANTGDRPIQVGSHYHFAETNAALDFDRAAARGRRLDIPAGTAVRFEPGQTREVRLVPYARGAAGVRVQRQGHGGARMSAERHTGSCQCGAVAFEAVVDIANPAACNCSRCQRLGSVLAFTPLGPVHAAARGGRADRVHLQQPRRPPPVLQGLRHPALRLRADEGRQRGGGGQLQLPRRRRPPGARRPACRRARVLIPVLPVWQPGGHRLEPGGHPGVPHADRRPRSRTRRLCRGAGGLSGLPALGDRGRPGGGGGASASTLPGRRRRRCGRGRASPPRSSSSTRSRWSRRGGARR